MAANRFVDLESVTSWDFPDSVPMSLLEAKERIERLERAVFSASKEDTGAPIRTIVWTGDYPRG